MKQSTIIKIGEPVAVVGNFTSDGQFDGSDILLKLSLKRQVWQGAVDWIKPEDNTIGLFGFTVDTNDVEEIASEDSPEAALADIQVGSVIRLKGKLDGEQIAANKIRIMNNAAGQNDEVHGKVETFDAAEQTLRISGLTVKLNGKASAIDMTELESQPHKTADTRGLLPIVIGSSDGSGSRVMTNILSASGQVHTDQDCDQETQDSIKLMHFYRYEKFTSDTFKNVHHQLMDAIVNQISEENLPKYSYFGWKNPESIYNAQALLEAHPDLKYIHLVRDPACMVAGRRQRKIFKERQRRGKEIKGGNRHNDILQFWSDANFPVWEALQDHPRYYFIRFEDIIGKPEETVGKLYDWLGLDHSGLKDSLAIINPPADATSRGDGMDISFIAEAAEKLGYGHRLKKE